MFLDIGAGIVLSIITAKIYSAQLSYALIFLGIGFSFIPDIDFFIEFFKHKSVGGKVIREHRELLHYPIPYLLCAVPLFLFDAFIGTLFVCTIFFHFLHDSIGIGWGIKWFWPFSKNAYKFFSKKDGSFSLIHSIVSWDPEELSMTVAKYGDPNWIKNIYFRFHPIAIIELIGFIIAMSMLFFVDIAS